MNRAGIVILGALLMGSAVQASAFAAPAGAQSFSLQMTSVLAPEHSGCSFDIVVSGLDQVTSQTTYDKSGTPLKMVQHIDYKGTQTAKGTALDVSEHAVVTVDMAAGTETVTGQLLRISLPKGGNLVLDVGRIVTGGDGTSQVQHGWHPATTDIPRYCAAFGN
ncbi:MAG: hypothetical protein ABR579_07420 [Actinomycetota bacterium]